MKEGCFDTFCALPALRGRCSPPGLAGGQYVLGGTAARDRAHAAAAFKRTAGNWLLSRTGHLFRGEFGLSSHSAEKPRTHSSRDGEDPPPSSLGSLFNLSEQIR